MRLSKILRTRDVKALQDYIIDGTVSLLPDVLAVNEWELDGGTDTLIQIDQTHQRLWQVASVNVETLSQYRPECGRYVLYHAIPSQNQTKD